MKLSSKIKNHIKTYLKKRFRIRSAGEIRLTGEDFAGLYNPYYARASDIFHVAGFVSAALLVIFILGAVLLNIKSVTYENLYYFVKDFDAVVSAESHTTPFVIYSYEENRCYAGYKGGIIMSGASSVSVFSATGRKTATYYPGYAQPVIRASSKYFIVYDQGGKDFSVYNSFARLYTETLDYPILSADISEDGSFLILTSEGEYKSAIYRYGQNFQRDAAYYYNDYVISQSLTADGKFLLVSPAATSGGRLSQSLYAYPENDKNKTVLAMDMGELIVGCGGTSENSSAGTICYYYIGEKRIFLQGREAVPKEITIADTEAIMLAHADQSGLVAALSEKQGYLLHSIPYRGEIVTIRLDDEPKNIKKRGNIIFVLYSDSVARYDTALGTYEVKPCAPGGEDLIISSEDFVFVCYASRAVSLGY